MELMKQFKCRIWNTKQNIMLKPDDDIMLSTDGKVLTSVYKFLNRKDCIILLYTGLKDKNGKEIYEGDIIQKGKEINGWIEYENGGFHCVMYNKGGAKVQCFHLSLCLDEFEVIGKIYENPELIKKC